jgi:6-pyruvoyltetrahydropterin/6-carboxytetrahydropterin synthase
MAIISKMFRWEGMHILPGHQGACARPHGHSYSCEIFIDNSIKYELGTSDDGMVADFYELTKVMKPIIETYLDHHYLNQTLNIRRTTAELIACWLFGTLYNQQFYVSKVVVSETKNTTGVASYRDWAEADCPASSHSTRLEEQLTPFEELIASFELAYGLNDLPLWLIKARETVIVQKFPNKAQVDDGPRFDLNYPIPPDPTKYRSDLEVKG